ncbi:MAG: rhomboid family intramembrane serine protease [Gemmatimonadetes bacterium]|nr:rhomboid family intramembrane serine protease [Gemmatimonadota bacterium]
MSYTYRTFGFGYRLTPVVKRLLIANVAVFGLTLLVGKPFVYDWFAFQPRAIFIRPWGVFTYMFVHAGFWHLAWNMLFLFFFGPPVEERWGSREFFKYYVICGLGGVGLSYLFMPNAIVGASAAILGVMLAFAMIWPDAPIYLFGIFPVKAKWLVAALVLINVLYMVTPSGGGIAYMAHLGGLATGFIYLKSDWRLGRPVQRLRQAARARRMAIVPREEHEEAPRRPARTGARREDKSLYDAVDAVLDKISAEGMASLTPDELKLLDEVSKRHRSN